MPRSTTSTTGSRMTTTGSQDLPPKLDFSSYPPCVVAWTYTTVDTVCDLTSPYLSSSPYFEFMDCSNWRDWLPSSWTDDGGSRGNNNKKKSNANGNHSDNAAWLSLSNKYPRPVIELLPPLTTYEEFVAINTSGIQNNNKSNQAASSSPSSLSGSVRSTASSMWQFSQTPSTTLADLTSGSALLALVGLVWLMRRIKASVIPFFSRLGKQAALHTHGEEWCTQPSNQIRITKFGEYVFRLCFHSMISITGIVLFWDSPWWADVVGSHKSENTIVGTPTLFLDFPYQPIQPGMIWYYLIQAAYNVEAMICLLELSLHVRFRSPIVTTCKRIGNNNDNNKNESMSPTTGTSWTVQSPICFEWSKTVRGDFREMFIHHVVTNLLIFGSSFIRMTRVGSMVFLVHDMSDVPVDLSKLANFLKWKATTVACFVSMVLIWLMTRLYILPFVIFRSVITESWLVCANGYIHPIYYVMYLPPFMFLMGLLILLHLIWFSMFIHMGYVLVRKGEAHDLSEHKEGEHQQHLKTASNGSSTANGVGSMNGVKSQSPLSTK